MPQASRAPQPSLSIGAADLPRLRVLAADVLDSVKSEESEPSLLDLAHLAVRACEALTATGTAGVARQERPRLRGLLLSAARGEAAHTTVQVPVQDCRTLAAVLGEEVSLHDQADALDEALDLLREHQDGGLEAVKGVVAALHAATTATAPLTRPLSAAELAARVTGDGDITVVVAVDLDDAIEGDLEAFNDSWPVQ